MNNRRFNRGALAVIAASALVLGACSDSDDSDDNGEGERTSQESDDQSDDDPDDDDADDSEDRREDDPDDVDEDDLDDDENEGSTGDSTPAEDTGHSGLLDAISLAQEESGGTAFEVEQDDSQWEVTVATSDDEEVTLRIDAEGTTVNGTETDGTVDAEDLEALQAADITISDAIETAVAESQAMVDDVALDAEGDGFAWEVSFTDGVEVYVDVASGEILRTETD